MSTTPDLSLEPEQKAPAAPASPGQKAPVLAEELKKMEYEPLLPVEKKLIATSILLGLVLLVFFVWISYTFFPGVGHH